MGRRDSAPSNGGNGGGGGGASAMNSRMLANLNLNKRWNSTSERLNHHQSNTQLYKLAAGIFLGDFSYQLIAFDSILKQEDGIRIAA